MKNSFSSRAASSRAPVRSFSTFAAICSCGHAAHHQIHRPALHDPLLLPLAQFRRQRDLHVFEQVTIDLLAHGLLHVIIDAFDHLLAQRVAQLGFVLKAEALEEFRVHFDRFELLEILERDLDFDFLAAELLVRMRLRRRGLDRFASRPALGP